MTFWQTALSFIASVGVICATLIALPKAIGNMRKWIHTLDRISQASEVILREFAPTDGKPTLGQRMERVEQRVDTIDRKLTGRPCMINSSCPVPEFNASLEVTKSHIL